MVIVKDFKWNEKITGIDLVKRLGNCGYQSSELKKASDVVLKMKKEGCKIFLTFTSNMVTSGLRGFFAQLIKLGLVDVIVTTIGSVEEDIMKANGEEFKISSFEEDDIELKEKGINRIGNILINNESYQNFEDTINKYLKKIYEQKKILTPSELFNEIGKELTDEDSILYQATKKGVKIFCPAITDGSFGFHLHLFKEKNKDFNIDVISDFKKILEVTSYDDKKGIISLGGGVSKHHALLSCLLNGGVDYAIYLTTSTKYSGSVSGATTNEAKSWGKVKDDSDVATVIGDVSFTFPLVMVKVLETLNTEGFL